MTSPPEGRGGSWAGQLQKAGLLPGKEQPRLAPPPPHPSAQASGSQEGGTAGQGHWSQAQSQWAATAVELRNLVVSGQAKEPRGLPCVYLAPWSSWELDLCGDLAWVTLPKEEALTSQGTPPKVT